MSAESLASQRFDSIRDNDSTRQNTIRGVDRSSSSHNTEVSKYSSNDSKKSLCGSLSTTASSNHSTISKKIQTPIMNSGSSSSANYPLNTTNQSEDCLRYNKFHNVKSSDAGRQLTSNAYDKSSVFSNLNSKNTFYNRLITIII